MHLYYLKKSGRITGPFPLAKLNLMNHDGSLTGEEMYSEDKIQWHYIDKLFPSLRPGQPFAWQDDPAPASGELPAGKETSSAGKLEEEVRRTPLQEFLLDVGRTIALLWNFHEILERYKERSVRYYCIALTFHIIIGFSAVLPAGRSGNADFHYFFSPLMGVSLELLLFALCSLFGWLCARRGKSTGTEGKNRTYWQICAAGIFMNYGTMTCCILALYHGLKERLWILLLLMFINSFILCSTAALLRDYAEYRQKSRKGPNFILIFLWNPVILATAYYFTKLI